jgi:hypothetical protein
MHGMNFNESTVDVDFSTCVPPAYSAVIGGTSDYLQSTKPTRETERQEKRGYRGTAYREEVVLGGAESGDY